MTNYFPLSMKFIKIKKKYYKINNAAVAHKYQNSSRQVYSTINREFPSKMQSQFLLYCLSLKKNVYLIKFFLYSCTPLERILNFYRNLEQMPALWELRRSYCSFHTSSAKITATRNGVE